ncbi:MAG: Gfo/Idh/MocA family protein [Anaerocolumna sp.]
MNKVRLGVIGFGAQGSAYANFVYNNQVKGMQLGAVCDIDSEKREKVMNLYPEIPVYDDYISMIESGDVDAVITTVPHYLHPDMGIKSILRGMPVIIEKPAGVYTKQVKELLECAKLYPEVPFAIMFNQRTNPLYQEVKKIISSGELGEIRRTNWIINTWWRSSNYYNQSQWRATWGAEGGGVLVNQAPHQLDLIQWLCGKPKKVYANCKFGLHRNILVENDVTAILDYGNGATGVFVTSTHDIIGTDRLEIDCDCGKIIVDNSSKATVQKLVVSETETDKNFTLSHPIKCFAENGVDNQYEERKIEFASTWGNQHCIVLENFAAHLLHGEPILAPGSDGIYGVQLANAILLSSWLGKEVDYDFDEDLFIEELNKRIKEEGKYPLIKD